MSSAFRRSRAGVLTATFHVVEIDLLRSLVARLLDLVRPSAAVATVEGADSLAAQLGELGVHLGPAERPDDPVLLRLFPDAYRDDVEAASDFRRYTEGGLRDAKTRHAEAVLANLAAAVPESATGGRSGEDKARLSLDADAAESWLRTLTDLRLALGTRLGVEQDDEDRWAQLPEDDPAGHVHDVYEWLGWVQETLVRALPTSRS